VQLAVHGSFSYGILAVMLAQVFVSQPAMVSQKVSNMHQPIAGGIHKRVLTVRANLQVTRDVQPKVFQKVTHAQQMIVERPFQGCPLGQAPHIKPLFKHVAHPGLLLSHPFFAFACDPVLGMRLA